MSRILLLSLAAVVLISGCTIPGTSIAIPFLPNFFGPQVTEYEHDILVIRNLQVVPGSTVKAGQPFTVFADIQNLDRPEKGPLPRQGTTPNHVADVVEVELFDFCSNLMSERKVNCPGEGEKTGETTCSITQIFPKEIKTIRWTLTPKEDLDLEQECELKLKVRYPYQTDAITQISFINDDELNNRIRRGEAYQIAGSEARGEGPVKPYLHVESQQPISTVSLGQISFQIRNVGAGFVPEQELINDVTIEKDGVNLNLLTGGEAAGGECMIPAETPFLNKETPPRFCSAEETGEINVIETFNLKTSVSYNYEFRASTRVKIVPRESAL